MTERNRDSNEEEFDPIVRISNPHSRKNFIQPDLDLAEYYYESMNDADIDTDHESHCRTIIGKRSSLIKMAK